MLGSQAPSTLRAPCPRQTEALVVMVTDPTQSQGVKQGNTSLIKKILRGEPRLQTDQLEAKVGRPTPLPTHSQQLQWDPCPLEDRVPPSSGTKCPPPHLGLTPALPSPLREGSPRATPWISSCLGDPGSLLASVTPLLRVSSPRRRKTTGHCQTQGCSVLSVLQLTLF